MHFWSAQDALRRSEAARKRAYRDARAAKEELRSIVGRQSAAAEVVQGNQALLDQVRCRMRVRSLLEGCALLGNQSTAGAISCR